MKWSLCLAFILVIIVLIFFKRYDGFFLRKKNINFDMFYIYVALFFIGILLMFYFCALNPVACSFFSVISLLQSR